MRKSKGRRFVIYLNPKSESKSFLDFLDFDLDGDFGRETSIIGTIYPLDFLDLDEDFGRETSIMGTIHPLDFLDLEAGFGEDIPNGVLSSKAAPKRLRSRSALADSDELRDRREHQRYLRFFQIRTVIIRDK